MARIHLIRLRCDRAEMGWDTVALRVVTPDGHTSTRTHRMKGSMVWEVGTSMDFEDEATISLVQVDENHSLGRLAVTDEPTTSRDSPYSQFKWHEAHYTLVYRIQESPAAGAGAGVAAGARPYREDGYCVAPYENNRVRYRLPRVLIYHPTRNKPGKTDAGTFTRHSSDLAAELEAWRGISTERIGIDNGNNDSATAHENSSQILADLEAREASYTCLNREDRLRAFVIACHGFPHGVQLGFSFRDDQAPAGSTETRLAQTERLLDLLASMSTDDLRIILYACSTGAPNNGRQGNNSDLADHYSWWQRIMEAARDYDPPNWPDEVGSDVWGEHSFAAFLRNGLHTRGRTEAIVYGHSDVAHAFWFPGVLRFECTGGPPPGGEWVIDPGPVGGSDEIRTFREALRADENPLRFRYPWMTTAEIEEELGI